LATARKTKIHSDSEQGRLQKDHGKALVLFEGLSILLGNKPVAIEAHPERSSVSFD
jgi:hypothetical protein